jgi:hypothetical protein
LQRRQSIPVRRRSTVAEQSGRDERVECPGQLGLAEPSGSSRASYGARGLRAVQQGEQRAEACAAEDQRGLGFHPDLDLVGRALNDRRIWHEPRILNGRVLPDVRLQ